MPDPISATIGVVGGGLMSGIGASKAASAQKAGAQQNLALQREMFEKQTELLEPFRALGLSALPGLGSLSTPEGQAEFYGQYYQSPQFQAMANQARNQQLAAAEATGGLGSTSTQNQLARIAPELGMQALSGQQNILGQLANIGLSGAGSQAGFAGQFGQAGGQAIGDIAAARAGQAAVPFQVGGQMLTGLAAGGAFGPGGLF